MKLFITSKVSDPETKAIDEIEKEVQKDIDNYIGKYKVIFKLYITGKTAVMYFYRGVNNFSLYANSNDMIIVADAYMIKGEDYNGFKMPCHFYKVPYGYSYSMEQSDFLKACKDCAYMLEVDKIKKACLEIDMKKIVLRVNVK